MTSYKNIPGLLLTKKLLESPENYEIVDLEEVKERAEALQKAYAYA